MQLRMIDIAIYWADVEIVSFLIWEGETIRCDFESAPSYFSLSFRSAIQRREF